MKRFDKDDSNSCVMLKEILFQIKKINDQRKTQNLNFISEDESNEEILEILLQYNLEDNEDALEERFGRNGFEAIRDYEQGLY